MSFARNILKKVFPRILLKGAFGAYNRIRIATVDRYLFPEHHVPESQFRLYRKGYPFRENNVPVDELKDADVKKYMSDWNNWTQEEFILEFNDGCVIEPKQGWAITNDRKLLYYSLGISRTFFLKKPEFFKFLSREDDAVVEKAVSFRDTGEENYFHFFNDVVAKYYFLKSNGVSLTGRILILSRKLYDTPYFQFYIRHNPEFRQQKWMVQDVQYIAPKSVIFCKPLTHRKDLFDEIFKPLIVSSTESKRLFISRRTTRLRFIQNGAEVFSTLKKFNIEPVDPDMLTPDQQRKVFSEAGFICGIHGAGLTNIYFRNGACQVLEIFPPPADGYLPFHYIMLASMKDFGYQAITGEGKTLNLAGGFSVDTAKLETMLRSMLS